MIDDWVVENPLRLYPELHACALAQPLSKAKNENTAPLSPCVRYLGNPGRNFELLPLKYSFRDSNCEVSFSHMRIEVIV